MKKIALPLILITSLCVGAGKPAKKRSVKAEKSVPVEQSVESPVEKSPRVEHVRKGMAQNRIANVIYDRWSPRAMSGESISDEQIKSLFEAVRFAPSSYNGQPWRFVYAKRETGHWVTLFNLLVDFNKTWCINAALLGVIISKNTYDNGNPNPTHSFDAGAAWQNLSLQGSIDGLVVHGMSGFDYAQAKEVLQIPDGYTIEAMFAVGKPGPLESLPEYLRKIEAPSPRNPIESFIFEGVFKEQQDGAE
jgi:nitroreductase